MISLMIALAFCIATCSTAFLKPFNFYLHIWDFITRQETITAVEFVTSLCCFTDASPSAHSNFLHVPTDSPGRFNFSNRLGLSPSSSPLRPSPINSPSTPYSPMRNLRISDPYSPAPASPSRKRQSSSIKTSLSSNDLLGPSPHVGDGLERESSSKAKLGRFTCKTDSHVKHRPANTKQFSLDSWWQGPPDRFNQLNPDQLEGVSASLPASPNHVMPPKWRFKHRKHGESAGGSNSEPLTPEIKRSPIGKRHSDVSSYENKYIITQSRDNTIAAYQNNEELIVVSNDITPDDDDVMDTGECSTSAPITPKRRGAKIFRTPSEEVREINEGRMKRDAASMTQKVSLPPPIIRILTPSQHEAGQEPPHGRCPLFDEI